MLTSRTVSRGPPSTPYSHLVDAPIPVKASSGSEPSAVVVGQGVVAIQGDVVLILAYTGLRFGELMGLNVEDVDLDARRVRVRPSMTQVGGRRVEGNPKSMAGRRSVPIPERLVPLFKVRIDGRPQGAPAVASGRGSLLGLKNWKRSVRWRSVIAEIGREKLRVHDLRHTYASLSRRAGADLRLLQKAMGHASALDSLGDF